MFVIAVCSSVHRRIVTKDDSSMLSTALHCISSTNHFYSRWSIYYKFTHLFVSRVLCHNGGWSRQTEGVSSKDLVDGCEKFRLVPKGYVGV